MATITLQFSRQEDFGSDAIRLFERGEWSHVDAVMPDGSLLGARDDVSLGIPSGVRIRPNGYLNFASTKRVSFPASDIQAKAFYDFLMAQVGKSYDETAILAFMLNREWREQDSWFCSELAAAAVEACGVFPYKLATSENKITPEDLFLAASVIANVWG